METKEYNNDEWFVIKMEQDGKEPIFLDNYGNYHDTPYSEIGVGTIADAKDLFAEIKETLPSDAEYSIEKVEEVLKTYYVLNLEL